MQNFLIGGFIGIFVGFTLLTFGFPKTSRIYLEADKAFKKEAYENGHMEKEISKDDKVIYRWKHLEKIGYEE